MMCGLVDMIVTCFHMLKIPSDGNFYMLLEKKKLLAFSQLKSAKFYPWTLCQETGSPSDSSGKPINFEGAQWLSGRVLDSRSRGRGFEPHRRHCVVVLEKDTFILA